MILPADSEERKNTPIWSGVLMYFPLAIAAVARLSKAGNDKHNPGEKLHWAREKSTDHEDCIARHLIDVDSIDPTTGEYEDAKALAWRALAKLQLLEEKRLGKEPGEPPRTVIQPPAATDRPVPYPRGAMCVVYVAHPLGDDPNQQLVNRKAASQYVGAIAAAGYAPVADWITISKENPNDRQGGLAIDVALVARCDELWLCGERVSPGMRVEAEKALSLGITVKDMTKLAPNMVHHYADSMSNIVRDIDALRLL